MSSTIQIRRGLEADRGVITFAEGEILFTTDSPQALYIGDGSTSGGLELTNVRIPAAIQVDSDLDVGINTSTPDAQLHVFRSDTTVVPDTDADDFMIEGTGAIGMTIASSTTGIINFADSADSDIGAIEYSHSSNSMVFRVNAATAITIDSSQRVGIGVTPTAEDLEIGTGILIGNAAGTTNGTIRYTGTDFEGRLSGAWESLTGGGGGNTIYTANDSLSGNRIVTTGSADLTFSSSGGNFLFFIGTIGLIDLFTIRDDGTFSNTLFINNSGGDAIIAMRGGSDSNAGSGITNNSATFTAGGNGRQLRLISTFGGRAQIGALSAKSNPEATLHIIQETTGVSALSNHMVLESTDPTIVFEFLGTTTSTQAIYFGDTADQDIGRILYNHSTDNMSFYTSNTENIRIQSSGTVNTQDEIVVNNISLTAEATLHVYTADSTVVPTTDADDLFVENNAGVGITLGCGTTSTGSINFGDSGDADIGRITYTHSTNHMAFYTNASEQIRIESGGDVAIGTTSADGKLHVFSGNSFGTADTNANTLVLEASANGGISILTGSTSTGAIYFGDFVDVNVAQITYNHASNFMAFTVNASERVRIDSSGRVNIGTTTSDGQLHVFTGDATATSGADADELVVEASGNGGISLLTGNANTGNIFFGDSGDNDIGRVIYDHSNNSMSFYANATEIVHLRNGALGIVDGITAPSNVSGYAFIYVDTADGDLKVVFGDGTVATIVTD